VEDISPSSEGLEKRVTVRCEDDIGCEANSYKHKVSNSYIDSCPLNVSEYDEGADVPILLDSWVCGYGKDLAGNEAFSSPTHFKGQEITCTEGICMTRDYDCPNGCEDGECIRQGIFPRFVNFIRNIFRGRDEPTEEEPPERGPYYRKETCIDSEESSIEDTCLDADTLREAYCVMGEEVGVGCILEELSVQICSYGGVDYRVKRETQCNFEVSYNGITEEFELLMLTQITLQNGVIIRNPDSCSSQEIGLTFSGEAEELPCSTVGGTCVGNVGLCYGLGTIDTNYDCGAWWCCVPETNATCTDTDGGIRYRVRGEIYVDGVYHNEDKCTSPYDGSLNEWYCDGSIQNVERYECLYGCEDGACVSQPPERPPRERVGR
jgi:hypothetical protein